MIRPAADGVILAVRVIPRASRSVLAGTRGDAILVRLAAPPVDDAANDALIELLASSLGVPRHNLIIEAGRHSRKKQVRVRDIDADTAAKRLGVSP